MPPPILFFEAARRRLLEHQGRPRRSQVPMWRLLWWEVTHGIRWFFDRERVVVWAPAVVVALLVMVGLDPRTPGPVLDALTRTAAALIAASLAASISTIVRSRTSRHG